MDAETKELKEEIEAQKVSFVFYRSAMDLALASLRNNLNFVKGKYSHFLEDEIQNEIEKIIQNLAEKEEEINGDKGI